jgi:aminoglycoside phosphotransferase (APT) family kinase protein
MSEDERRAAVSELAAILQCLHRFECPEPLPAIDAPQILTCEEGARSIERIIDALSEAQELAFVDPVTIMAAKALVRDIAPSFGTFDAPTFVHGDLHFENVLWDGEHISALLDFEFARAAPPDLDLDVLLRFCAYPFMHVAEDYEHLTHTKDYDAVPWWLAEDYPELFGAPKALERMRMYSIAYDVRDLLSEPPRVPVEHLSHLHPYHRLDAAVRGESHLDRLANARVAAA